MAKRFPLVGDLSVFDQPKTQSNKKRARPRESVQVPPSSMTLRRKNARILYTEEPENLSQDSLPEESSSEDDEPTTSPSQSSDQSSSSEQSESESEEPSEAESAESEEPQALDQPDQSAPSNVETEGAGNLSASVGQSSSSGQPNLLAQQASEFSIISWTDEDKQWPQLINRIVACESTEHVPWLGIVRRTCKKTIWVDWVVMIGDDVSAGWKMCPDTVRQTVHKTTVFCVINSMTLDRDTVTGTLTGPAWQQIEKLVE